MHAPGMKKIKLDTPEEIARWREERRKWVKNYEPINNFVLLGKTWVLQHHGRAGCNESEKRSVIFITLCIPLKGTEPRFVFFNSGSLWQRMVLVDRLKKIFIR